MAECAYCRAETQLYKNGVPTCLQCDDFREPKSKKNYSLSVYDALVRELTEARLRLESATMEFNAVTSDIPSFVPQPDGTQRIHNASRALKAAHDEMIMAHNRLNAYLERGTVPEDLKRSG